MVKKKFPIPLTGLLAGAILTLAGPAGMNAQQPLQAKLAVRPLTNDEIKAYKLPDSIEVSGGLSTVGVGQPLYLELQINSAIPASDITGVTWDVIYQPPTSKAVLADSPLGSDVPIYEPSQRLVAQVAGRKMLRPDVEGAFAVMATVMTASNGSTSVAQTYIAATYVGAETCSGCHGGLLPKDIATPWSKTGHASMLKNGINGTLSSHYSGSCIECHTVGYDTNPNAVNGGFDDIAAKLNWKFPAALKDGNWDAVPDQLKTVSNIQCENCHGPGSVHITGSFEVGISVSTGSGVCSQCHAELTNHSKSAEWANSVHAVTTRDPSGPGRETCVGCHTGNGFVGRMKGSKTVNAEYSAISCQTCHDPHGMPTPDNTAHLLRVDTVTLEDGTAVKNAGMGGLCMNCHHARQNAATYATTAAASSHFGPHHGPQADMLEGANGYTYGQKLPSSAHASVVEDTCVGCHMQAVDSKNPAFTLAGGHTFRVSWKDAQGAEQPLVAACQKCHGDSITSFDFARMDYDGDGQIDGVQTEVQHLMDSLSAMLPPVGQAKSSLAIDATWTRAQLEAAYNWQFVHDDGSRGVHNAAYTVGLLKASIADLAAKRK